MRVPRWLKILLSVIGVFILVALVAPMFLDVDRYRSDIQAAIKESTGREAKIGKISARLLPSVSVVASDVALSNPPGFPAGNVVSVEAIRCGVEFWPLLSKELRVTSLELDKPRLTLLTDASGRTNYDFSPPKKSGGARPGGGGSAFQLAAIPEIELSDVEVIVARVVHARGTQTQVTSVHATGFNATLHNVSFDEKKLKEWAAESDLSGASVVLGGFKNPLEFNSGKLTLKGGALSADFDAEMSKVGKAKGQLSVADITKSKPVISLSSQMLDLGALMAATDSSSPASPAVTGPSELVATGKISADRLRYESYEASNAKADVKLYTDRLEFSPVSMAMYGGSVSGSLRLDQRSAPSRLGVNAQARGLDVAKILDTMPQAKGKMTGTADLSLNVSAPSGANMLNAMSGTGDLAVRDGTLPGINLGALQTLGKVQSFLGGGGAGGGGTTRFSLISADLNIGGGRVASNRVHVDSNLGTVDLRGSFGFDETLAYDGNAVLAGGAGSSSPASVLTGILGSVTKTQVASLSIPFAVTGTFSNPKVMPGKGIPSFKTATSQPTQQPQQQKPNPAQSILDLFKKKP